MTQCQICQSPNEDAAQFCRECGGRLQSAPPAMPPAPPQSFGGDHEGGGVAPAPAEAPKRQRLHSPMLGGGSDMDDDDDSPSPSFKRVKSGQGGPAPNMNSSQSGTGNQRRGGLRSPLLGGDGDDMDEEDVNPRAKGGFPHMGGKQKKTEFPHRHLDEGEHRNFDDGSSGAATGGQKTTGARGGLRSPLLGGGGDDDGYDDAPAPGRGGQRPTKPGKLRSPILGGGGGDDYYDDEVFDEVAEDTDDPTVLRSPLLAVRTPKAKPPAPPQNPNQNQPNTGMQPPAPQAPYVGGPYTQASASGNAPNFALNPGPNMQPFPPNPGPGPGPNQQAPAAQTAQATMPVSAPMPAPMSNQTIPSTPQPPTQQPAYSPPPAPPAPPSPNSSPDSYNYGYQAPLPPAPSQPAPRPNQQALPPTPESFDPPAAPAPLSAPPAIPAPSLASIPTPNTAPNAAAGKTGTKLPTADVEEETPKLKGMRGSKLLGDVSDDPIGPLDRRTRFNDRRSTPRDTDRRGTKSSLAALHQDDDMDSAPPVSSRGAYTGGRDHMDGGGGSAPNPMAPILMISAVIALIAKGYYISSFMGNPEIFSKNMPATIDQVTTMLVLVGIILFAMKASQKN